MTNDTKRNQKESKTWSFVCCGQRYDSINKTYLKQMQKKHEKTIKHKINQAVADSWVKYGKFYSQREKALIEAYEGAREITNEQIS